MVGVKPPIGADGIRWLTWTAWTTTAERFAQRSTISENPMRSFRPCIGGGAGPIVYKRNDGDRRQADHVPRKRHRVDKRFQVFCSGMQISSINVRPLASLNGLPLETAYHPGAGRQ
jgi:hypothetical protein